MIGKNTRSVNEATDQELSDSLIKLNKVIKTHPQKSQKAQSGSFKKVILQEMGRRVAVELTDEQTGGNPFK
tara:strand:+ start:467 stop:679 length:213 start_codon:yes stop_codon:yes gene_type:complete